jgi:aminomethyltransferase
MSLNLIPHTSTPLAELLTRAAFAPLDNVGWIRVTGEDRVRWLNGMVTNNIAALKPGEGCYNFFLNAQGRIQGDATAFLLDHEIRLETMLTQAEHLVTFLDRFIIMDDVQLQDWNSNRAGLLLAGPDAEQILDEFGFSTALASLKSAAASDATGLSWRYFDWKPRPDPWPIELVCSSSAGVPCYEIWSTAGIIEEVRRMLEQAAVAEATPETLEQLRILSGTPLYGIDIRDKDLPQETNQTRALHFAKGCYLGQEIVERIRSRGAVHRTFGGFILHGEPPAAGAILSADDKPVGELTSVTSIQLSGDQVQFALGYIRREALDRNATITYPGGIATPAALPFQLPELRALHA